MSQIRTDEQGVRSSRAHETRVVIDAPVEDVWKAITEASEISRWFAPGMTVEPGVGGNVKADWGQGIEWKCAIEVWEPNRHLRLTETRDHMVTPSDIDQRMEPCRLVEDFYLETEAGKTVLRLVHSGFGASESWDAEYEGTKGGWAACFLRLKLGLERHRNETVHNFLINRVCPDMSPGQVLPLVEAQLPPAATVVMKGDLHLSAILPELNGSLFTVSVQPAPSGTLVYVEFLLFGQTPQTATECETAWRSKLARLVSTS